MTRFLTLFVLAAVLPAFANASIMNQGSMPPAAIPAVQANESTAVHVETEAYPQRFSFGLGSGMNSFGGNRGKLYQSRSVVLDLRGEWAYLPGWSIRVGGDLAEYAFNAAPNGSVRVSTQSLQVASQSHFLSTALASSGFDPYLSFQGQWVNRSQNFQSHNSVEKDSALGMGAGLGANYLLEGGKLGFWLEAGISQILFKDRFEQEYLESGLEDTTGALYSGRIGVKYHF